jgi:hypothetical protein
MGGGWMPAQIEFEWRKASRGVYGIVIREFQCGDVVCPVRLLVRDVVA